MRTPLEPELPHVHLLAGQLVITREPQVVVTVLGSCVTVTMFERRSRLAAICHTVLPRPREGEPPVGAQTRFRYATHALPAMFEAYRRARIRPDAIEVKLFGGADVIGHGCTTGSGRVGADNVATVRQLLQDAGLSIAAENTLGQRGRKLLFNTVTGEVLHKRLHRSLR